MAKISAWMAVFVAAAVLASLVLDGDALGFSAVGPIGAVFLLCFGAYRTFTAKSGGLRLLCGAWGTSLGMAWYAPSYNFPDWAPGIVATGAPVLVSALGLALTVLHKEAK